jgi:Uncharacterised nucleotidyltransferase
LERKRKLLFPQARSLNPLKYEARRPHPDAAMLLSRILAGAWRDTPPPPELSTNELDEIAPLLVGSGVAGFAWWRIRHSSLAGTRAGQELRDAFRVQVLHEAIHEDRLKRVFTAMRAAGVEPILIKGWAIGRMYPESGLRPSGDIDLHVSSDLYDVAARVLNSSSGGPYDVDFSHEESDMLHLSWHEILAHSELVKLEDMEIRVMGPEHHLALLCIHFLKHGGWRPLWLCDIAVALESRSSSFDWELCLGPDARTADWIACTLGVAHILLGADVADTPVAERAQRLPHWLVPAILRAWERPRLSEHTVADLITTSLRHPTSLPRALQARWLNPLEATVRVGGAFNELPRLPYQIANYALQIRRFATRLETMVRPPNNGPK